jgi:hypothetical protein
MALNQQYMSDDGQHQAMWAMFVDEGIENAAISP